MPNNVQWSLKTLLLVQQKFDLFGKVEGKESKNYLSRRLCRTRWDEQGRATEHLHHSNETLRSHSIAITTVSTCMDRKESQT